MRSIKHIVKILLMVALIMCFGIALGYEGNIKRDNNLINFYFEKSQLSVDTIKNMEESEDGLPLVGWREDNLQSAVNPDLNRTANNLNVLSIKGSSSLLTRGQILFKDDLEGCLIDEDASYKLFGSLNCVGREILYNDRTLVVRGILKGTNSNIMIQLPDDSSVVLNGLTIDGTDLSTTKISDFRMRYGIDELDIDGGIYHMIAKVIVMIVPLIALLLILIKIVVSSLKVKNKPVLILSYVLMFLLSIFIVLKVSNIKLNIPLDMLPNKWSDFSFWGKMIGEYAERFEVVMYMKKYGIDIYNIQNMLKSIGFSILSIVLFVISLKVIKISNLKELIVANGIVILASFATVMVVWFKFGFDVNITMLWWLYPLYLCGDYFMKVHQKYMVEEDKLAIDIEEKEISEEDKLIEVGI